VSGVRRLSTLVCVTAYHDDGATTYDDGNVACTDTELVIRRYYLPVGGTKRIPYPAIREVRRVPLTAMGRWRIQGSNDFVHWFSFDIRRPRKTAALVVHSGGRILPVVTPDDPDRAAAALAAHGVRITNGDEAGL
jgi:hypothetical protein